MSAECVMGGCCNQVLDDLTVGGSEICPDCEAGVRSRHQALRLEFREDPDHEGNLKRFLGTVGAWTSPVKASQAA